MADRSMASAPRSRVISNDQLTAQQERVVAAVREWTRLSEMDAEGPLVREAYFSALTLVRRFPEATAYLLSIWYQPDDAVPDSTPPEGQR